MRYQMRVLLIAIYYFFNSSAGCVELLKEEMQQVQSLLTPLGVSNDQLEEVYAVLRKAHCSTASMQVGSRKVSLSW